MNKSIKILVALIFMSTIFVGCKKDKEEETNEGNNTTVTSEGYFSHDNTEYKLSQAYTIGYGEEEPGVFNIDLLMASSGLTFPESADGMASGIGNLMIFELYTSNNTKLDLGEYTVGDDITMVAKTISYGIAILDFDASVEESGTHFFIESGTLNVINNSSTLEVEFDFITEDGKALKGNYKGVNKYFDDSGNKGNKKMFL